MAVERVDPHEMEADALEGVPLPRERAALIGHGAAERALLDAYRSGRMHHAWILAGPKGIGKSTLAFRFARFVLAHPDPTVDAVQSAGDLSVARDTPTFGQVASGAHPGLLHLRRPYDAKRKAKDKFKQDLTVDEIRRAVPFFGSTGAQGSWRICIVDAADDMNVNAANALLKVLEEPPRRSLFLVLSHAPGRLLPTIRSRCRMLRTDPLTREEVRAGLLDLGVSDGDPARAERIADLADGSLRTAITLARGEALDLADLFQSLVARLPELDPAAVHAFAETVGRPGADEGWTLFLDLIGDHLHARLADAATTPLHRLVSVTEVWEKTSRAAREADAFNLDRKQVVLNAFRDLAAAARS